MAPYGDSLPPSRRGAYRHVMPHLTPAGGAPPPGPTRARPLEELRDFGPNPGALRALAHVPADLPPGAPLVVALHGCGQTAAGFDRGAGWSDLAGRLGFALLLPEQNRSNHGQNCFQWFEAGATTRGRGEVASIRAMIEAMVVRHGLDRDRIFVTGLSAGGGMTAALLACYPETFAAGAIVAGLPYGSAVSVREALDAMRGQQGRTGPHWGGLVRAASPHAGPWPRVSIWHGQMDHVVTAGNAAALTEQWRDVHGLSREPDEVGRDGSHAWRIWRGPAGEALMEEHLLAGMGHGVPLAPGEGDGCCGEAGPFLLDVGVSSTWRIAESWGLMRPARAGAQVRNPVPEPAPEPAQAEPAGEAPGSRPEAPRPAGPGRILVSADGLAREEPALEGEVIPPGARRDGAAGSGGRHGHAGPDEPFWLQHAERHVPEGVRRIIRSALSTAGILKE